MRDATFHSFVVQASIVHSRAEPELGDHPSLPKDEKHELSSVCRSNGNRSGDHSFVRDDSVRPNDHDPGYGRSTDDVYHA